MIENIGVVMVIFFVLVVVKLVYCFVCIIFDLGDLCGFLVFGLVLGFVK